MQNAFFCLQKRRGHGEGRGLAARFIGTLDSIRESKVRLSTTDTMVTQTENLVHFLGLVVAVCYLKIHYVLEIP